MALAVVVGTAAAAPGDVDAAFGTAGVVRTDIGTFDSAGDLAVQSDGRIVVAGSVDQDGTRNIIVARYLANGALDETFGSGGLVVPDRHHQVAPRLALQSDGKIVVATRGESAGAPVFVYRFGVDGALDDSFGDGGTATMLPPAGLSIVGVAGVGITNAGALIVALRADPAAGGATIAFARFGSGGTPDPTFGSGGFVTVGQDDRLLLPLALSLEPGGDMLVGGFALLPSRFFTEAFVARFQPNGSLDESFGAEGFALVQRPSNGTEFQALSVASDGSILAGGREWGSSFGENRWLLAKLTGQGQLDPDFGEAGLVFYDPGPGDDVILDLAATPTGVYATGWTSSLAFGLPLALFTPDGALDTGFGAGGITGLPGEFTSGASRLALQEDGKVIVYGSVQSWTPTFNQDLYLTRYEGRVHGRSAAEQVVDLRASIVAGGLSKGAETSLVAPLATAERALAAGRSQAACQALAAFVNTLTAQQGRSVPVAAAEVWLGDAGRIRAALGCE